jgi:hypothetical protein
MFFKQLVFIWIVTFLLICGLAAFALPASYYPPEVDSELSRRQWRADQDFENQRQQQEIRRQQEQLERQRREIERQRQQSESNRRSLGGSLYRERY